MIRSRFMLAVALTCISSVARGQSLSLATATYSGDCTGTTFSQMADGTGRFLSAGWAVANQFPIGVNKGRGRCTVKWNVSIAAGYTFVPGGGSGNPARIAIASFHSLRLNGSTTHALIESTTSIDGTGAMRASAMTSGPAGTLLLDREATSPLLEGACSTPTKTTFQISVMLEAATASNYTIPWPPEPYAERETASMGEIRFYYTLAPCTTRRAGSGEQ